MNNNNVSISDYISVKKRLQELGCRVPLGLALLPRNLDSAQNMNELIHENSVSDIRKLWRLQGIQEDNIEPEGLRLGYVDENAFDVILPAIFCSAALLSQDPQVISLALNVVYDYITDFFKGVVNRGNVKTSIVIEKPDGSYKNVQYDGPVEGLRDLASVVNEVANIE